MHVKHFPLTVTALFAFFNAFGQHDPAENEMKEYKIGEKISIEFEVPSKVDSTGDLKEDGFWVIAGPNTTYNFSSANGHSENKCITKYIIRAQQPGPMAIASPVFYSGGKQLYANEVKLEITGDSLSDSELRQAEFEVFREMSNKPEGTIRYVLNGEFGYIEMIIDSHWKLVRELSKEEMDELKLR